MQHVYWDESRYTRFGGYEMILVDENDSLEVFWDVEKHSASDYIPILKTLSNSHTFSQLEQELENDELKEFCKNKMLRPIIVELELRSYFTEK